MHLFVGLGNPGRRYRETPHNAGFLVCDRYADRNRLGEEAGKFQGRFRRGRVGGADVGVLKPQTYMNLSGDAVAAAVRYLPLEPEEIVLVFDDMDLPLGKLRHMAFFFAARADLGRRLGYRGVYPPPERTRAER